MVLVPRTSQGTSAAAPAAGASGTSEDDIETFVRQIYERGYLQGRLAERRTGGRELSQADLERLGR